MKKGFLMLIMMLLLSGALWCGKGMLQVQAATVTDDLKFLSYCDENESAVWDQQIAKMDDQQAAVMKDYIEHYIIDGAINDYEKALMIYNWIFENVTYASDVSMTAYLEPYDVFLYKTAVCGGYSNLYKAMLNLVGIPSVLISGMTPYGGHVWNAVYANEMWFYSDATWGGDYFHKTPEEFMLDHYSQRVEFVQTETPEGILVGYDNGIAVVGVTDGMTTVNVPESFQDLPITSISYQLFGKQYGVKVLNIGESVQTIANVVCDTLEAINVSKGNQVYASRDGVLFSSDLSRVWMYPLAKQNTSFTLPKETTVVDFKETFMNTYLTDLNVESGNTEYSSYEGALYNADQTELFMVPLGKTKIYVPDDAQIGDMAFANADTSKMTIYTKEGTPAYEYAIAHGIAVVTEEETETKENVADIYGDVKADEWYVPYVQYVYDHGLMSGNGGLFRPTDKVTRVQVVSTLYRMEGSPAVSDYRACQELLDVKQGEWYTDAICWAYNTGVAAGNSTTKMFNVNTPVNRQQLASFLYRYAEYKKMDISKTADISGLLNADQVLSYAEAPVKWAVAEGIITGSQKVDANGQPVYDLAPLATATRAQLASILQRFCEK